MEKASSLAGDWLFFERFNDGLKSFVVADEGSLILWLLSGGHCQDLGKAEFVLRTAGAPYEIAHFLAPPGIESLTERGEAPPEYALERQGQVRHRFLEHALALSEFRLKLELALRHLPFLSLRRFTADFEVRSIGRRHPARNASSSTTPSPRVPLGAPSSIRTP